MKRKLGIARCGLACCLCSENETPRRILKYCGTYVAEICDDESNELVWAVLSKWKGVYHFSAIYGTLDMFVQSL